MRLMFMALAVAIPVVVVNAAVICLDHWMGWGEYKTWAEIFHLERH